MSTAVHPGVLPRAFGRYTLFDLIGRGGMAEIYLAQQKLQLGGTRLCVVKQILPTLAGDSRFSEMLVHEAKLAARLSHANVVQVFELGREDDRLFIAMEYVEGFDTNSLLGRCSRARIPLPLELAIHVVREALRGLDYAHRQTGDDGASLGIVHRDVSPSNLLISFDGEVKVCDFGIAHANDAVTSGPAAHELDEALRGKASYMSPEHARGKAVDARADVFAVGVVLWELLAGRRMYRTTEGVGNLLEKARRAEVPPLPALALPEGEVLRAVVGKALAVDRDSRYGSAVAMLRDLDDYAAQAKLRTSALQLGEWLSTTFGAEIISRRRSRERAMSALERGAPLSAEPIASARAEPIASARAEPIASARAEPIASAPAEPIASAPAEPIASAPADPSGQIHKPAGRKPSTIAIIAVAVVTLAGLLIAIATR